MTVGLRPPFAYYGGKTRLAGRIVGLIGDHRIYTEPFAGSLAVLLSKRPSTHEVVNDLDGDVVNFWRQLRDHPEELARVCRHTPYGRSEFLAADHRQDGIDDLERARRWWVRVTQSHSRLVTSGWSTGFSRSGSRAHETVRAADRMLALAHRLRMVSIECRPAIDVLTAYDSPDATHYVDPPYPGQSARNINRKQMYAVDMHDDDSHRELAAALGQAKGHVLLSGYDCPLYGDLYAGWERIEFAAQRSNGGHASTRPAATEVIWSNRPLVAQPSLSDLLSTEEATA